MTITTREKEVNNFIYTITPLTTRVVDAKGNETEVVAVSTAIKSYPTETQYHVKLLTKDELNRLDKFKNKEEFVLFNYFFGSMTLWDRDKKDNDPSYIYIQRVDNNASSINLKHVGAALEEYAFRFSVEKGREGRVELTAAWSSHLFHFKNGFRCAICSGTDDRQIKYYNILKELAEKELEYDV